MYPPPQNTVVRALSDGKVAEINLPLSQLGTLPGTDQVALAFDGCKILDIVTQTVREENPLAVYTSSTPVCVYTVIDQFFILTSSLSDYFTSINKRFKPVFVFDGCGFAPAPEIGSTPVPINSAIGRLNANLPASHFSESVLTAAVRKSCADRFNITEDLEALIVRRIHEAIPDTFRAPYLAWSQISSFFAPSNNYISEVYGNIELLAFPGVDRVITKVDIKSGTFDCVTKVAALKQIRQRVPQLTEDDFSALLLLESKVRGFSVFIPHGGLSVYDEFARFPAAPASRAQRFLAAPRFNEEVAAAYRRNLAAVDAPVMTIIGKVVPLSGLFSRPKVHNIKSNFGKPEPAIFYNFMFSGAAMPAPFAALSQNCFVEDWPLVDTAFFRGVCERILPLRVQACFQLFQYTGFSSTAKLRWLRQFLVFRSPDSTVCWSAIHNPPEVDLAFWDVDPNLISRNPQDFVYFLDVLKFAPCGFDGRIVSPDMATTLATILLKSLDLIGYFTHSSEGGQEASSVCCFSQALDCFDCQTLSEYGVLMIELVRTGTLTDAPIEITPLPASASTTRFSAPPGARFAARAVSIIPINLDTAWTGPFDPEMAAFGAASRLFGRTLRLLTEVNAAVVFATGSTRLPLSQFDEVLQKLPYAIPIEFNAGFLMMHVLMDPKCTISSLKATFPDLVTLEDDLATLFWFWSMTFRALTIVLIEDKEEGCIMEPAVLLNAHQLMGAACYRLCRSSWDEYYPQLNAYAELIMQNFFAPDPNIMQQPPPPGPMYNNNNCGGY